MAFKKHNPRRFTRAPIRREPCPYCDGTWPLDEFCAPFEASVEGNRFPFTVCSYVRGGKLMTKFRCPDRQYRVAVMPKYPDYGTVSEPCRMDVQKKLYEPQEWAHVTQASYCPKCGRNLMSKSPRVWR